MANSRTPLPLGQEWFINRMKQIVNDVDEQGVCFGLAAMCMQAILANDLSTFERRLRLIHAMTEDEFAKVIEGLNKQRIALIERIKKEARTAQELNEESIQKKIKEETIKLFSEDERIKLDIPVFLQGLKFYHNDDINNPAFEKRAAPRGQNIIRSFPLVASKLLEKHGGISQRRDFSCVYNIADLAQYFNLFQATVKKHDTTIKQQLVFIFKSCYHAITVGYHPDTVKTLCEKGADVNQSTIEGLTPLFCAAYFGHHTIAKTLIENGALPNQADAVDDVPPIYAATQWDDTDLVSLLLENGANPDLARKSDGITSLYKASMDGYLKTVKALLKRADPNLARTDNGLTPLLIALENDHIEIAKELLIKGARHDQVRTSDGMTPLCLATWKGFFDVVEILLKRGADANQARTSDNVSPLCFAAVKGFAAIAKTLCGNGARPNQPKKDGITPLHLAASKGHEGVAQVLLENDANPDLSRPANGYSPLHIAATQNQLGMINLLLQFKAKPDSKDANSVTPLHIAIVLGHIALAAALLEKGANPNQTAKDGATLLFLASQIGNLKMVELLLLHNARLTPTFKRTSDQLRSFAKAANKSVEMDALINTKHPSTVEELIVISPKEIAMIMGHHDVVGRLELEEKKISAAAMKGLEGSGIFQTPEISTEISLLDGMQNAELAPSGQT